MYLTQWPFAYWYPMTVFLMLMPYAEESAARINNRVLGNLLGLLMTALLLSLFQRTTHPRPLPTEGNSVW